MEGAMSPLSSFECDRSKIEAIEEAFDAVWTTIQASEPIGLETRLRANGSA
jgi:hypothetical protein